MFYFVADDVVYNQSMPGNATMGKQRPDLHDELGYIAPPNRKLPPVPGSNYNTCDRIKRGTNISKVIAGGTAFSKFVFTSLPAVIGCWLLLLFPGKAFMTAVVLCVVLDLKLKSLQMSPR